MPYVLERSRRIHQLFLFQALFFLSFTFFSSPSMYEEHNDQDNDRQGKEADVDEQHGCDPDAHREIVLNISHGDLNVVASILRSLTCETEIIGNVRDHDTPGKDEAIGHSPILERVHCEVE